MQTNIEEFGNNLRKLLENLDFSPIFPAIEAVCHASVIQNFSNEGRYGSQVWGGGSKKWTKSQREGQTLSDRGHLRQSITVECTQEHDGIKITVGSNLEYAAIHHFGFNGTVNIKSHERRSKRGKKYSVRSHNRSMNVRERPYFVLQDDDIEQIKDLIKEHIRAIIEN